MKYLQIVVIALVLQGCMTQEKKPAYTDHSTGTDVYVNLTWDECEEEYGGQFMLIDQTCLVD